MTVVYYVNTYYLDAALETIQAIKNEVTLHVFIELSPESKRSNIIDIEDLGGHSSLQNTADLLPARTQQLLDKYFEGVASVQFVVHKHQKSISLSSFRTAYAAWKFISACKPDVVHFDSVSPRVLGLYPFLARRKIFITVHDPLPHSGEGSWKVRLIETLYFRISRGLFFYSQFAADQFKQHHSGISAKRNILHFQPFSFVRQNTKQINAAGKSILFFGRILVYKGVDLLLEAIPEVLKKYPDEQFVIAGEPFNCELNPEILKNHQQNIRMVKGYISTEQLSALIQESKFVICPYRDATQSGVVMTSYAFGKMVLGTNVGAFPEYIHDGVNGILTEADPASIAHNIVKALDKEKYKMLEKNITATYSAETGCFNKRCLLSAYQAN